jgi:hypothetical protein
VLLLFSRITETLLIVQNLQQQPTQQGIRKPLMPSNSLVVAESCEAMCILIYLVSFSVDDDTLLATQAPIVDLFDDI